ncbi:hypothetical protein GCM10028806_19710 [Spirosoma terrae]
MMNYLDIFILISVAIISIAMLYVAIDNLKQARRKSYDEFVENRKQRHEKN